MFQVTFRKRVVMVLSIAGGLAVLAAATLGFGFDVRIVQMKDQCDPTSFNAAIGPGTCVGHNGGVSFDTFLSVLRRTQRFGAWHFAPREVRLHDGQPFQARNDGGEAHTFTEVDEFGGGIVPLLNQLSGNPEPAPECLQLGRGDFIAPGDSTEPEVESRGTHHCQCCIHPWMRADVTVQ